MHVKLGAAVLDNQSADAGKVECLVIDPGSRSIVQFVAKQGFIDARNVIVDRSMVNNVDSEGNVHLNLSTMQVKELREFVAVDYAPRGQAPEFDWKQAVGRPLGGPLSTVTDSTVRYNNLPENVVLVKKGTDVQDVDFNTFGEIEDVEFDQNATITGFTVRSGNFLHHSHQSFKIEQVAGVGSNYVRVNLTADQIRQASEGVQGA